MGYIKPEASALPNRQEREEVTNKIRENICKPRTYERLTFRLYKELRKLNVNKINNSVTTWPKYMNRHFVRMEFKWSTDSG